MTLEQTLSAWTGPSSDSELDKQERTERMVREAIDAHVPFADSDLSVYAKGSYANNTNVVYDSDVDIVVECREAEYWEEAVAGAHRSGPAYAGLWTPSLLRAELVKALQAKFKGAVDVSGSTAIIVHSNSARVDADVVPCFSYRYYFATTNSRAGTKIFKTDGNSIVNYPIQQLENGRAKNQRTGHAFKKAVRILKRVENAMVESHALKELPSYFVECLAYNCPDSVFLEQSWLATIREALIHIWNGLQGDEPAQSNQRWVEVNECFYLFHAAQKWTRADGRNFAYAAWKHLSLS